MPRKRGPGRPFKPSLGPEINRSSVVFVSDAVAVSMLKELISQEAFDDFLTAPRKSRRVFIDQVKKTLFTLTGDTYANPNVILQGEYGDLRGVNISFSIEEFAKNPVRYVASLPRTYVEGIFNTSDLEREIELEAVKEVATRGAAFKKAFPINGGNAAALQLVEAGDPTQGKDGIASLAKLNENINNWANNAQLLVLRKPAEAKVIDSVHSFLAEELVYGDRLGNQRFIEPGANGLEKIKDSSPAFFRLFREKLNNSSPELQALYNNFKDKKSYQKYVSKEVRGVRGARVSSILGLDGWQDNAYEAGKVLDTFLGGRITDSTQDPTMSRLRSLISTSPKDFGFNSLEAFDAVAKKYVGTKVSDVLGPKDSVSIIMSPGSGDRFTRKDIYAFNQIILELRNNAAAAKEEIRNSIEKDYRYNRKRFNSLIATFATPDQNLQREIAQRLGGVANWEEYVRIRSLMEDQEDFVKNLSKGTMWQAYFYLGRYNDFMYQNFPIFQEMHKKILNLRVPVLNKRLVDIQFSAVKYRNDFSQWLGLSGEAIDTRGKLFLGRDNVSYLYMSEFDPRITKQDDFLIEWVLNGNKKKLAIFQDGLTHTNLRNQANSFRDELFNIKAPLITAFARDFKSLPDVLSAMEFMAANNNLETIEALRDLFNATKNSGDIKGFLLANGVAGNQLNQFTDAFNSLFNSLEKYKDKGLGEDQFFDFALLMKKKFMGADGKVKQYLPFLNSTAVRLSNIQTYLYRLGIDKVAYKVANSRNIFARLTVSWYRNFYNPRFGALNNAQKIVQFLENSSIGRFWSVIRSSPLGKLFGKVWSIVAQTSFTNVGSFTAWLAVSIAKFSTASLKAVWLGLRGRFKDAQAEFAKAWDDVVVKPITLFVKIILYVVVFLAAISGMLGALLTGGLLEQTSARKLSEGVQFTDYNQEIPISEVDGQYCVIGGDYGATGNVLEGVIKDPVSGSTSYAAGQCPAFSPGSARDNFHAGLDYSVPIGSQVTLPFDSSVCGKVVYSGTGWNSGYGGLVKVEVEVDGERFYLLFGHLSDTNVVKDKINADCGVRGGDVIGLSGNTGNSTGPHLHFEIRDSSGLYTRAINPCSVISCPSECFTGNFGEACADKSAYE